MKFKKGMKVRWHDPAINEYDNPEEALKRVFTVYAVREDIIYLWDGHSEVEAMPEECEIV